MKHRHVLMVGAFVTLVTYGTIASVTTTALAAATKTANGSLTVTAKETSLNPNAVGATLTDDYFPGTKKIGGDQVSCMLTGPGTLAICNGINVLPKGDIMTVASIPLPPPHGQKITIAILGGTGSYSTARGTVDYTPITNTDKTITFHIST